LGGVKAKGGKGTRKAVLRSVSQKKKKKTGGRRKVVEKSSEGGEKKPVP